MPQPCAEPLPIQGPMGDPPAPQPCGEPLPTHASTGDPPAPWPCGEPLPTHASTGALQRPGPVGSPCRPTPPREPSSSSRWLWFSPLWCHCSFPLGLGAHKSLFVPSRSGVSVSSSPLEVLKLNPADPQVQISWGFPVLLSDPQTGKPDVGFRTITTAGELLLGCCSPVCGSPSGE